VQGDVNAEAIETWNGVLFEKFLRFQHILTTGLAVHGDEALRRHPPQEGEKVLDLGCGFGDTTREIAKRVGPKGVVTGVDAAERFVEQARRDAEIAGIRNARFFAADVQTADLGGPHDMAFSRFGTMFCSSPVAEFRNIGKSLVPGGELVMVVWRRREDNRWLYDAELRVREIVPDERPPDASTCGPGPFSMSGPDMVSDQLHAAGFTNVSFERFDALICIGKDLDEAVGFAMALGPAGELLRLAGEEGERLKPTVDAALRDTFSQYVRADGVFGPSSTWLVSARRST
jgi:SAM-dependent methyltransferase